MDLDSIADELYAVPVADFTSTRDRAVKAARDAGDSDLADTIKRLRRPTVGAWLVNQLVREQRDDVDALIELGGRLRDAQEALAAGDLRQLSGERRTAISALVKAAKQIAADHEQPVGAAALSEVSSSLEAGSADADSAAALTLGRLEKTLSYSGFGPGTIVAPPPRSTQVAKKGSTKEVTPDFSAADRAISDAKAVAAATKREVADAERRAAEADVDVSDAEAEVAAAKLALAQATQNAHAAKRALNAARKSLADDEAALKRARAAREKLTSCA